MTGTIFAVKHFAVHDGDGIRTTVFFKGCPLSCIWCHNPESKAHFPRLAYYKHKCISCGECVAACRHGAHAMNAQGHFFDRSKCIACGECEDACLGEALEFFGKSITPDELLPELLEDKPFYDSSGGGVTFSGGECLLQADFCRETALLLKKDNINIAVDTCGFVPRDAINKMLGLADVFLYDIKAFDEQTHIKCTSQSNKIIWENLRYITQSSKCEIRIPFVPDYNSNEIGKIAEKLSDFKNITRVRVLPYHNFSGSKYDALDMNNTMPTVHSPTKDELFCAVETLKSFGLNASCASLK